MTVANCKIPPQVTCSSVPEWFCLVFSSKVTLRSNRTSHLRPSWSLRRRNPRPVLRAALGCCCRNGRRRPTCLWGSWRSPTSTTNQKDQTEKVSSFFSSRTNSLWSSSRRRRWGCCQGACEFPGTLVTGPPPWPEEKEGPEASVPPEAWGDLQHVSERVQMSCTAAG